MRRTLKFFVALLCAALVFAAVPCEVSAAGGGGISVSAAELRPGDAFTVTLSVPAEEEADTASVRVEFDQNAFEVLTWEPTVVNGVHNSGAGFFTVVSANAYRVIDLSGGLTLTAFMKVKDSAANGNYRIDLVQHNFSYIADNGYGGRELWEPQVTSVTVRVSSDTTQAPLQTQAPAASGNDPAKVTMPAASSGAAVTAPASQNNDVLETTAPARRPDEPEFVLTAPNSSLTPEDTTRAVKPGEDDPEGSVPSGEGSSASDSGEVPVSDDDDGAQSVELGKTEPKITLTTGLSGISGGKMRAMVKSGDLTTDTEIRIYEDETASASALMALADLGLEGYMYYAFDISLLNSADGTQIHSIDGGFIEFEMPLPDRFGDTNDGISVYHIPGGKPEKVSASIENIDGRTHIRFRAGGFSPYMIVDENAPAPQAGETGQGTVSPSSGSSKGGQMPGQTGQQSQTTGNTGSDSAGSPRNPTTGITLAVLIPSVLGGCAVLAKKTVNKRRRTRRYIEE